MKEYRNSIFSIRKLSIGVVSLCIGTGLFLSSLTGLQVEASEQIATVDQEIRFHYLLEEELSPEEKSRIVQQLPKDLRQEATYFLVYRPQSPKVLPATGEVVSHAAAWLAAGFLVIAVQAIGSKKSRVVSLLYITMAGSALPLLQVDALQSHALAHFNQTVTVKSGDLLPDGKLELASYDFVGYIVEDGKVDQTVSSEQAVEQVTKQPQILDSSHSNQTVLPEKAPVSEQVQTEETGLQLVTRYREEKIPLEIERLDVEDPNLALGETRLEAGQAGYRIQRYEEKWLGNQLQSSHLMETQEVVGKPEILYRGTKTTIVQEEVSQVPSDSPQATPPVRLDFQLKERVDRQVLSIPEERIETDRLAQGETETVEGQTGLLEITYQDVIVDGKVIASNEVSRRGTPAINRKVYVGTRVDSKEVEPLTHSIPEAIIVSEEVPIPFEREQRSDPTMAVGTSRVEAGKEGLSREIYAELNGVRTHLKSEEITPAQPEITYVGSAVDEVTEEELPLVERIVELADQYTDYILEVQAGYPGRRKTISRNGEVIRVETEEGQEKIVHIGIKPIEGTVVENLSQTLDYGTVYQADPNLAFGVRQETEGQAGQEVFEVTYRTIKGQKTEEIRRKRISYTTPVDKVITFGTQATEEEVREALPAIYEADDTIPLGQKTPFSDGREKVTVYRTTYVLDEETGQVSSQCDQGTLREVGESPIIRVGTQPKVETLREPLPVVYQADTTRPTTSEPVRQAGRDKVITLTTTYSVNPNTGEVTAGEPVRKVTDEGQSTVITVGTQATEEEVREALPAIYEADDTIP
ncbi:YSIRK-type signal peptide-containing protein, partial [Streptococcus suis]|nr:YSIRK-type signal peptide-containing protein [Streptococcus suis]